jgi:hypothetical protein
MAAATADRETQRQDGKVKAHKMAASRVFKGTLVMVNATGFVQAGTDAANTKFAGMAYETKDNTTGAPGDRSLRVEKTGEFLVNGAGFTQADVGKEAYITDDNTVQTAANTNGVKVGAITEYVSATQVRIRIDNYVR